MEAQQKAILDHPQRQFYNLNIDVGAMWSRRLIDKMIRQERALEPSAAAPIIPIHSVDA
jgi:hypothetical protein